MALSDAERIAQLEIENRLLRGQLASAATEAREIWSKANNFLMDLDLPS